MSELEVDELISRVYDVALKICEWPEFLAATGAFCRAQSVALVLARTDQPPEVLGEWSDSARKPQNGRSPGTILHLSETLQLLLTHAHASTAQDIQVQLEPLLPHIRRVASIQKDLETTAGLGEATAIAFADRISTAVLIYDRHTSALLHGNPASERLLGPAGQDRAAAVDRIQRVMRRLLPKAPEDPIPGQIRFDWSLRESSLVGVAAPLSRENSKVATSILDRLVLIFLHDPNRPPALQSEHLRARYGLTSKESRLALGVVYGGTLTSLAEDFRVSTQTLRSQMKSILRKVGVKSQAQMTAVLLQDDMLLFAGESV